MTMLKGKVITKKPNEDLKVVEVDFDTTNTLKFLQEQVEGYIEVFRLPNEIDVWLNEEGKLEELEPNVALVSHGQVFDFLVGNLVFASSDNDGNTIPLNEDQLFYIQNHLLSMGVVRNVDNSIVLPFIDVKRGGQR